MQQDRYKFVPQLLGMVQNVEGFCHARRSDLEMPESAPQAVKRPIEAGYGELPCRTDPGWVVEERFGFDSTIALNIVEIIAGIKRDSGQGYCLEGVKICAEAAGSESADFMGAALFQNLLSLFNQSKLFLRTIMMQCIRPSPEGWVQMQLHFVFV